MSILTIERRGGLAGFGGVNLKSEGRIALADLVQADQARVEELFRQGSKPTPRNTNDAFTYRITLDRGGRKQTIEVPESDVPGALAASVRDTLR